MLLRSVWVGNLPKFCSSSILIKFIEHVSNIIPIDATKPDRGRFSEFAIVYLQTIRDARRVAKCLNGRHWHDKILKSNSAHVNPTYCVRLRKRIKQFITNQKLEEIFTVKQLVKLELKLRSIKIHDLGKETLEEDLEDFFQRYGVISSVYISDAEGIGNVTFESYRDVYNVIFDVWHRSLEVDLRRRITTSNLTSTVSRHGELRSLKYVGLIVDVKGNPLRAFREFVFQDFGTDPAEDL